MRRGKLWIDDSISLIEVPTAGSGCLGVIRVHSHPRLLPLVCSTCKGSHRGDVADRETHFF